MLRVDDRAAWSSGASAGWLAAQNAGAYKIQVGSVVVITEGSRAVGYFHVSEVLDAEPSAGHELTLQVEPLR